MKITSVDVYEYIVKFGQYTMSGSRSATEMRSMVVRLGTDEGVEGWAETCPHGALYLPTFFEAERVALEILSRAVIGLDPRDLGLINVSMDATMLAGSAAKSAIDAACWDITGKSAGLPVSTLLGGQRTQRVHPVALVSVSEPEFGAESAIADVKRGFRRIQIKVGDAVSRDVARVRAVMEAVGSDTEVWVDANGGWTVAQALEFIGNVDDLGLTAVEQPCQTMHECGQVAAHTRLPVVLDECVTTMDDLMNARYVAGIGGVNLKPGRIGGLTKTKLLRDVAQDLGMMIFIDDTWGGSLASAQNISLAASTNPDRLLAVTVFSEWSHPNVSSIPAMEPAGHIEVPSGDGLGVTTDERLLAEIAVHPKVSLC